MVWTKCAVGRVPGAGVPGAGRAGRGGFYKFFIKKKKKEKLFGCHFVIRDGRAAGRHGPRGGVIWVSRKMGLEIVKILKSCPKSCGMIF
jgi:hypothetical protein